VPGGAGRRHTALRSRHRLESAQAVCALSIEAFGAPLGAYDAALDDLWGDAHEAAVLRALRRHLDGAGTDGRRFHQAPVSYRIIPRVLGQAHRVVAAVEKAAATALRAVTGDVLLAGRVLPQRRLPQRHGLPGYERAVRGLGGSGAGRRASGHRSEHRRDLGPAAQPGRPRGGADRHLRLRLGGEQLRRGGAGRGRAPRCCPPQQAIRGPTCCRRRSARTAGSAAPRNASTGCWPSW